MILALNCIIPPNEWLHKSDLQSNGGWTVAMKLASKNILPPKEWKHKSDL